MRRILLITVSLFLSLCVQSQEEITVYPHAWLRADSTQSNSTIWRDVSGNERHGHWHSENYTSENGIMNYNKSIVVNAPALSIPGISFSEKYVTAMIVYQVKDSLEEQSLWSLSLGNHGNMGLTTHRISGHDNEITYGSENKTGVTLSSLSQSWKEVPPTDGTLEIAGIDSLPFRGEVSEFIFFENYLSDSVFLRWASYLALKYGITLYQSDYSNSAGELIWNYKENRQYSHTVTGIGRDTFFGLHQKQSCTPDKKLVFGTGEYSGLNEDNVYILGEGDFILIGCDTFLLDERREITLENNYIMSVYGNCLVQVSGDSAPHHPVFLQVDASGWEGNPGNYHLFIDRSGTGSFTGSTIEYYAPERVDTSGILYYSNIHFDTDGSGSDVSCFALLTPDSLLNEELVFGTDPYSLLSGVEERSAPEESERKNITVPVAEYTIYPNPTKGEFKISVNYPETTDITVRILSVDGKIVKLMRGSGMDHYYFDDHMPVNGQYLIEIESPLETKSLKLIVN